VPGDVAVGATVSGLLAPVAAMLAAGAGPVMSLDHGQGPGARMGTQRAADSRIASANAEIAGWWRVPFL
jgi:predicted NAD/FAD-dependent oxidoreductase